MSHIEANISQARSLIKSGQKDKARSFAQQANDDLNTTVEDVLREADKPENGAWMRDIIREVKSVK